MIVKFETTLGEIMLECNKQAAPITVENFIKTVEDGYYDGTVFHRVIDGFMIQGGGFETNMEQKSSRDTIKNEAANGLSNRLGSVAMARTPDPHSASSQFFINVKDNHFLDYQNDSPEGFGYCVFAQVIDGMDVVDQIKSVATTNKMGHADVPVDEVVLIKATVVGAPS